MIPIDSNNTYDSRSRRIILSTSRMGWIDLVHSHNDDDIANSPSVPAASTVTDSDVKIDVLENTGTIPL
ncbi:hypothetical protein M9Y10_012868 [Tritrichomonas musculus]|uniref:Uncharacterized protein n=1 Tax=Tritrichomonas musculus TaxID=1915356 RepID=A0ABR2IDM9_9EUKA